MIKANTYGLITLLLILLLPVSAIGEIRDDDTYSFEFQGESLHEVLKEVARITETDLAFDPQLVEEEVVYERIREQTVPDLLTQVLKETPLDYVILSSGTIVIVESVEEEPSYGTLAGKVLDERTGEPLPGATIMLADVSGGTTTNQHGNFSINRMMTGTYRIIFSYMGYETVEKKIDITPYEQVEEEVRLPPEPIDFKPVLITDHQPRIPGITGSGPVESQSEWEMPGYRNDAIRSLNLYSGVQYGLPMQDLHVQGGHRSEHKTRLDGVPIYNPYSFGQMFSAFSPLAIGKVQLHKAGYGVEQGSRIAGIVDLTHEAVPEGESGGNLQGDPLNVNLRGDLSLDLNDRPFKLMGAIRANYWNIYRDPTMEQTLMNWDYVDPLLTNNLLNPSQDISAFEPIGQESSVNYFDIHLSGSFELDDYNTLRGSFYSGHNYVSTYHAGQSILETYENPYLFAQDGYNWSNLMSRLTWDSRLTPRLSLSSMLAYSYSSMDHTYHLSTSESPLISRGDTQMMSALSGYMEVGEALLQTHNAGNRIEHLILRSDADYSISPHTNIEAGLDVNLVASTVDFGDYFLSYSWPRFRQHSVISSVYGNVNRHFGSNWKLTAGSRFTYTSSHQNLYAEPRISLQYDQPDSRLGYWSARFAGGLYRQFINQYEITTVGPTSQVPSLTVWSHALDSDIPKAYHASGSWLIHPTDHLTLELDAYYKWQPIAYITSHTNISGGYSQLQNMESVSAAFAETTQMKTYGAGLRFHQNLGDSRISLMGGYDYSISRREMESQFNRWLPTPWNEPHRLQARSLVRLSGNLSAVVKWQSIYGRTWGFRQAYYDYLLHQSEVTTYGRFTFSRPEEDELSPFHQLDISLVYQPELGPVNLDLRVDLINVLNRRNTMDWSLVPKEHGEQLGFSEYKIKKRQMPGFYPTLSLEIEL